MREIEKLATRPFTMTHGFKCSWENCRKYFNRKSDLDRHYRIHTNERPWHCQFNGCSKTFIQRSALTVHSRTHTGEKPHVCYHDGCNKAFSDSSSLARHRHIHTGKRPYICQEPTCKRRHRARCHPPDSIASPMKASPEMSSDLSYHNQQPMDVLIPDAKSQEHDMFAQHLHHPILVDTNNEVYRSQRFQMYSSLIPPNAPPIVTPSVSATRSMGMHIPTQTPYQLFQIPQAPQQPLQYLTMIQNRFDLQPTSNYFAPQYHEQHYQARHFPADGPSETVNYYHDLSNAPDSSLN